MGCLSQCSPFALSILLLTGQPPAPTPPSVRNSAAADRSSELGELRRELRATRPETRRSAVRRLAGLRDREAWRLVVDALQDGDGQVADEAQLRLGELEDAKVMRGLVGPDGLRSREAWVRLRVAEALGRSLLAIPGEELLRCVRGKDIELSASALWSFERLARRDLIEGDARRLGKKLERLVEGRLPGRIRAHALMALEAFDSAAALTHLQAAATSREPELRCAALELGDEIYPVLPALLDDRSGAVRAKAVLELSTLADAKLVLKLCSRLGEEERPRLRWMIVDRLRAMSGLFHGADPRPWAHWAKRLPPGWRASDGPTVRAGAEASSGRRRSVSDHKLPVLSDRVCLLADFSGSLWRELPDGRSRKEVTNRLVTQAIKAMPMDTHFNLVPYTSEPFPWQKSMRVLDRRRREDAQEFFERCNERGRGNLFGAVELVWHEEELDSLLILTDGAPTGGERWNLELMIPLLKHGTRFRPLAFDMVLVDARPRLQKIWRALADATGGRFQAFELDDVARASGARETEPRPRGPKALDRGRGAER